MTKTIFRQSLLMAFMLTIFASFGYGQGILGKIKERAKKEVEAQKQTITNQTGDIGSTPSSNGKNGINLPSKSAGFCFARIEVRSSWSDWGNKKYETRVYYSDVIPYTVGDAKMEANLWNYFNDGVAQPLKDRKIDITFYESDIKVLPPSYKFESTADAEKDMETRMANDKDAKYAIYRFTWKYNGKPKGEEMTQPKRVFGTKAAPPGDTPKTSDTGEVKKES